VDKEALAEVDDIIGLLSKEYQSKIPKKLKEFIKKNKDSLYQSNITELPRDISGLKKDTVVMLGMIYDKYLYDEKIDSELTEEIKQSTEEVQNVEIRPKKNKKLAIKKESIFARIINFFKSLGNTKEK
jgi:hypothetical protein